MALLAEHEPFYCRCDGDEYVVKNGCGEVVYNFKDCVCPRSRCPGCATPLADGKCDSMLCWHYGLPVPFPDVA